MVAIFSTLADEREDILCSFVSFPVFLQDKVVLLETLFIPEHL